MLLHHPTLTEQHMFPAGDLVNSLFAASQEVPEALQKLASKDPRFRKGHKKATGRGGGRGRGRPGQVGGAGLGFGNNAYAPGTAQSQFAIDLSLAFEIAMAKCAAIFMVAMYSCRSHISPRPSLYSVTDIGSYSLCLTTIGEHNCGTLLTAQEAVCLHASGMHCVFKAAPPCYQVSSLTCACS